MSEQQQDMSKRIGTVVVSLGGHGGDVAALVASLKRAGYHAIVGQWPGGLPKAPPDGCDDACCSWRASYLMGTP